MSKQIELYKGTGFNKNASLTRYEYGDGTTNHWTFRDRLGRPYNPLTEEEVKRLVKDFNMERVF